MKKVVLVVLAVMFVLGATAYAISFTDVAGHWAESFIMELAEKGIINGYGDGTFNPQGAIKKGEYLKLIMAASLPDEDWTVPSVKYDHWASPYIEVAEIKGIIEEGSIDENDANDEISRAQVVEILGRCDIILRKADQIGRDVEFYDTLDMTDEEYAMLCHCVGRGLIAGYDDSTFKPENTLTRAEVATILSRYLKK